MIRKRVGARQPVELLHGLRNPVAPLIVSAMVGGVHASSREDVRATHEGGAFMAADHEDFRTGRAVAQHDDGGGGTRVCNDRVGRRSWHRGQY